MAENLLRISADPFENPSSQHATEVEPDVVAQNATVVSTFQVGRFFVAGASGIGVATSFDAGRTWRAGILPGLTRVQSKGNTFDSVSDPAIAYDAAHGEWLVVSLPIRNDGKAVPGALISRSSDALHWSPPTAVGPGQGLADKTWIVCDGSRSSQFYGHCYVEWDDAAANGLVQMSTSVDGGLTWSAPQPTGDATTGIGGHPVVQPDGTVVVPMNDFNQESIIAFVSTDGGATWSRSVRVSNVSDHLVAGGLRTSPLPTAAVDSRGTIYAGRTAVSAPDVRATTWCSARRSTVCIGEALDASRSTRAAVHPTISSRAFRLTRNRAAARHWRWRITSIPTVAATSRRANWRLGMSHRPTGALRGACRLRSQGR